MLSKHASTPDANNDENAVERDGRITKSKLAEELNLSILPTWERVRKLEESGVIKGYRAELDWVGTFNASRIVVEVMLARHTERDMHRFEEAIQAAPEVLQCAMLCNGREHGFYMLRDIYHYPITTSASLTPC